MPGRRLVAVVVALLLPWEAVTSGSSTVRATGAHVAVSLESVRKIFAYDEDDPGQEGRWHADWVRENQAVVDAALPKVERVVADLAKSDGLALVPWSEGLPEAWSWAEPTHERSPGLACAAGCRVRLQTWTAGVAGAPSFEVEVALAAAPPDGSLPRLNEAIARALVPPAP